ncbi:MAG: hypothetical protein LUD77_05305 [Clostridiales bacterium]|nr:hypothetical protein [Clostridiales bacterium]
MKKEYEKPHINTIEIKGNENIAELSSTTVQDGTNAAYGKISYSTLIKY